LKKEEKENQRSLEMQANELEKLKLNLEQQANDIKIQKEDLAARIKAFEERIQMLEAEESDQVKADEAQDENGIDESLIQRRNPIVCITEIT